MPKIIKGKDYIIDTDGKYVCQFVLSNDPQVGHGP